MFYHTNHKALRTQSYANNCLNINLSFTNESVQIPNEYLVTVIQVIPGRGTSVLALRYVYILSLSLGKYK